MTISYGCQFVRVARKIICLCMLLTALTTGACSERAKNNSPRGVSIGKKQSPRFQQDLSSLRKRAEVALNKAQNAVLKDLKHMNWQPGDIWVLQECSKRRRDAKLRQFVDRALQNFSNHPYAAVIDPNAKPIDLPQDPGKGFKKFTYYCVAPFGQPPERAISFIDSFLETEGQGYVTTHQLAVIIWARQKGLKLPADALNRKEPLLKQIAEEQRLDDRGFTDLYAERAAFVMMYGNPSQEDAAAWVETILNAQQEGGYWYAYKNTIAFDGEIVFVGGIKRRDIPHPTALCMLVLADFLQDF